MIKCHRSTFSRKLHYKEHDKSLDTMGKRTIHCAKENKSRLWSNLSSNTEMILLSMTSLQCLIVFPYFYSVANESSTGNNICEWCQMFVSGKIYLLCAESLTLSRNFKSFDSSYIIIPAMNTYIYHLCFPRFCEIVG